MKDLKWLSIEDYANLLLELTVFGCMKGYLQDGARGCASAAA